jgi:UDP-3-O-[3-hydroxymyristoyl] glucosamine N-acyltransferase
MRLSSPIFASAFAKTCGAELHGPDQAIHGANEIHNVEVGDLTFVDHPKYYLSTLKSAASVVLIDKLPEDLNGKTVLVHPNPFSAYDALVKEQRPSYTLKETIALSANVHPSAIIEPGAIIGPKVTIGAHTVVEANAVVYGPTRIGKRCRIGANTVIGDKAFYFRSNDGQFNRWATGGDVVIGDDVEIGPHCCIARGVSSSTSIGNGTKFDSQIMIGHDTVVGKHCLFAAQVGIAGNVTVEDNVILYGKVGISQNVTIGAKTIALAGAGMSKSCKGGITYNGNPAQPAREWLKEIAMVRRLAKS